MVTAQLTPLRVLIVYGTNEGQTARIAQYLARVVRGRGCIATSVDLRSVPVPRLESYDAVIVGASLHAGKYQKQVTDAIGARWYYYMKEKMDLVKIGTAHLEAEVDDKGKLSLIHI